jgi:hypothetical protein
MSVPYDMFTKAFLAKVNEYDFVTMDMFDRNDLVDGYMKRAIAHFRHICKYDLSTTSDDIVREFFVDIKEDDMDEILDIVSEGMVAQWMKPYVYKQDGLELFLNTRDFTAYSPAEMLLRIGEAYRAVNRNFTNMMREYSYNHGDLSDLHL